MKAAWVILPFTKFSPFCRRAWSSAKLRIESETPRSIVACIWSAVVALMDWTCGSFVTSRMESTSVRPRAKAVVRQLSESRRAQKGRKERVYMGGWARVRLTLSSSVRAEV